jgi:lariat debranching enzyme
LFSFLSFVIFIVVSLAIDRFKMKIAIEGCCHGELDNIYSTLEHIETENNIKIDLLIICGDFQAARNEKDLASMAIPNKYLEMGTFWKYYAGQKKAPMLTIFVGGNHEASNYMSELPYGGWVAENIYYMGYANVINFAGLRIAGLSGIFNSKDFYKGHHELPPYDSNSLRSVYHVKNLETFRLSQIKQPLDIMVTHDWPANVYKCGDVAYLLRLKPFLADEIGTNPLGSLENERLLKLLQPTYWFSAHFHVKYAGVYKHTNTDRTTKFLALDKCLPGRQFLQVIDIEAKQDNKLLSLDPEWMCILKKTDHLLSVGQYLQAPIADKESCTITQNDLDELKEDFQNCFEIPLNFKQTAPPHTPNDGDESASASIRNINDIYLNEQTTLLCEMLNIRDPLRVILEKKGNSSLVRESTTQLYNNLLDESDDNEDKAKN